MLVENHCSQAFMELIINFIAFFGWIIFLGNFRFIFNFLFSLSNKGALWWYDELFPSSWVFREKNNTSVKILYGYQHTLRAKKWLPLWMFLNTVHGYSTALPLQQAACKQCRFATILRHLVKECETMQDGQRAKTQDQTNKQSHLTNQLMYEQK